MTNSIRPPARWRQIFIVWKKEMTDSLRDWRSLLSTLMFPLLMPTVIALTFTTVAKQVGQPDKLTLYVDGIEHAPELVEHLRSSEISIESAPENYVVAIEDQDLEFVLRIDEAYHNDLRGGVPAQVDIVADFSRREIAGKIRSVEKQINSYSQQIVIGRLIARGMDPRLLRPLSLEREDLATPQQKSSMILSFLPMFTLMAAFMGGMYIAIDSSAGERERRSLEPLLATSTPPSSLVLGKWFTTVLFSTCTTTLTLVMMRVAFAFIPLDKLGLESQLRATDLMVMSLGLIPLCMMGSALQILFSTFARSYREAQTYLSILMLAPTLPAVWINLSPIKTEMWMYAIPALAQYVAMTEIIRGDMPNVKAWLLLALSSTLICAALLFGISRLLTRERIVFGR